jgi:hypothetical protein
VTLGYLLLLRQALRRGFRHVDSVARTRSR